MSAQGFNRLQKATALVPLALLSAAWTASLAGVAAPARLAAPAVATALPDGSVIPTKPLAAPATVTGVAGLAQGVGQTEATQIVATSSTSGIPSAALAAYQRAASVIDSADPACALPWQLIAAIGRVESNHGLADGNVLGDDGLVRPGIYGLALDGTDSTSRILDTDGGAYDNDTAYDRAVGPMQFIPSTWAVVGVDADGDGIRNPQDIDDAALGTAVYLCAGDEDLSTQAGERAAVFGYNRSDSYVDLVLAIRDAYLQGEFTSIPNGTLMASTVAPKPDSHLSGGSEHADGLGSGQGSGQSSDQGDGQGNGQGNGQGKPDDQHAGDAGQGQPLPGSPPSPSPLPDAASNPGPNGQSNGNGLPGGHGSTGGGTPTPGPQVTIPPLPVTSIPPVDAALTLVEATSQCVLDGLNQLLQPAQFQQCVDDYMHP